MSETIPVVREAEALDEARAMGRRRFEGTPVDDPEGFTLEHFRDSAAYANHVLPTLRCMAGYDDRGHGTWTVNQDVALIEDGDEMDHPADATIVHSSHLLSQLVDAWTQGAYAAIDAAARSQEGQA